MAFIQPSNNLNRLKPLTNPIGYNSPEEWSKVFEEGFKNAKLQLDSDKHFKNSYRRKSNIGVSNTRLSAKRDPSDSGRSGRTHKSKVNKVGSDPFFPGKNQQTGDFAFSSGIKSGILVNTLEASSVSNSLLFLLSGSLFPCHDWQDDSLIKKLITKTIYHSVLTSVQADISYRSDRDFISYQFYEHFCSIAEALQIYYFVDSVLSYTTEVSNTNSGLLDLRRKFSAEILSNHEELRREILRMTIPINLIKFIGYMYQNFRSSELPNSPILRLSYNGLMHKGSSGELSKEIYTKAIEKIRKFTRINALLASAFPELKLSDLPPSSAFPIYDPNWLTFWYNSCVTHIDKSTGSLHYTRAVDRTDQHIYYGHFCKTDDLDGIFYASSSIFNNKTKTLQSGLFSPISDIEILSSTGNPANQSSLLCNVDGEFLAPKSVRVLSQSHIFHGAYYNDNVPSKYISEPLTNSAAQRVQTHSIDQLEQATSASTLFLFSGLI